MEFEINGAKWIIEEVDEATINNEMKSVDFLGVTSINEFINEIVEKLKKQTLKK